MNWIVLVLSGCMEAVWAIALGKSDGFTKLVPTVVFILGMIASMAGLAYAVKSLPTGTAYAVWVGIGASITVIYGMLTGSEPISTAKVLLIIGLIGCIIGLKLVSETH
ncbi:multidrug efflux SMR transporter [Slackia equolifaciens]|jgi:quaternary ammonium compound-resistance protein SugE|uniref:Ligand-binding protein SH3 n=1 Tax=Slackia equolifaciens TaxID=498718 RepID=A0A3N0AU30_9ACTN|nr:multidrug efflux SMR transporter [Slackia equolifaciens]RNL38412.1 ligand-binding protein SH3 [Slackia equolifaciens]HJF65159.1 multidrug efflux SMR transporter [Slackia equolifaciens]